MRRGMSAIGMLVFVSSATVGVTAQAPLVALSALAVAATCVVTALQRAGLNVCGLLGEPLFRESVNEHWPWPM